ncbi:MAG TPA: YciI family protein [Xanthobacteraceae bacterium]
MKHFVLEGEYLVPFDELADLVPQHRAFLQKGYDAGFFLCSGPHIPTGGGFLIARAESLAKLQEILADEPFTKAKKMRFSRITEFNPVQHQPVLKDWFTKP